MDPSEMIKRIGSGLLSFPVTHFDAQGRFDEDNYRKHCAWLLEYDVSGLFAAGGTGEFFLLTPAEVETVVRAAVKQTAGKIPVIAGCGYGTAIAVEQAKSAERAGADGILLLPPYLVTGPQDGLMAHVEAVCRSTKLGVIVYNRDNSILQADALAWLCDRLPNLVGYKDGIGDIELMTRVYARMGDRLTYIGGLPTAETFALPYLQMGVTTYSSAIFNFMPEWALHFYGLVRTQDQEAVTTELQEFVLPYIRIRDRGKGYAVAIVKAGMDAIGRPSGSVRSPLTDLKSQERAELKALIDAQTARMAARKRTAKSS